MVCFHISFCCVKKNDANTTFSVQLNLQNKMANPVPRAQVPTDSCSSHLSQVPLNVHRGALEVQGMWKTVGWSIYCDMSNIRNCDVTSQFFEHLQHARCWSVFHALTCLILTSILESMYNHHFHFIDLRDKEVAETAPNHIIMKRLPTVSRTTGSALSRAKGPCLPTNTLQPFYDQLDPQSNKKGIFLLSTHSQRGRPVLIHYLDLQIFAETVWALLRLVSWKLEG